MKLDDLCSLSQIWSASIYRWTAPLFVNYKVIEIGEGVLTCPADECVQGHLGSESCYKKQMKVNILYLVLINVWLWITNAEPSDVIRRVQGKSWLYYGGIFIKLAKLYKQPVRTLAYLPAALKKKTSYYSFFGFVNFPLRLTHFLLGEYCFSSLLQELRKTTTVHFQSESMLASKMCTSHHSQGFMSTVTGKLIDYHLWVECLNMDHWITEWRHTLSAVMVRSTQQFAYYLVILSFLQNSSFICTVLFIITLFGKKCLFHEVSIFLTSFAWLSWVACTADLFNESLT